MGRIHRAVITAGGTGSRLLPFTKETPKEMMPIYVRSDTGKLVLKPVLQVIYESIFEYGIREFCFVVGRGKRSVEDHFLQTHNNTSNLELKSLFKKIGKSEIVYVQQPSPRGFGDAVGRSKFFVGNDNFLLHAGDDLILSSRNNHLRRLENAFFKYDADMAFLVTRVKDPRAYGVIEGKKMEKGILRVDNLEEKPQRPKSNLAVIATYIFRPSIFKVIEKTKPDKKGEVQLADAVAEVISHGNTVAVELIQSEKRIDVGTPESYVKCINELHRFYKK
jgi:UTP--glucose-1-phosphate uridylyltransferase